MPKNVTRNSVLWQSVASCGHWTEPLKREVFIIQLKVGKYLQSSRHPKCVESQLISVKLVLLCMFQTICLMGIAVDWVSIPCLFSIKANTHWRWRPLCKHLPKGQTACRAELKQIVLCHVVNVVYRNYYSNDFCSQRALKIRNWWTVWLKSPPTQPTPPTVISSPYWSEGYQRMLLICRCFCCHCLHLSLGIIEIKWVNIPFMLINSSDCSTCLFSWYGLLIMVGSVFIEWKKRK